MDKENKNINKNKVNIDEEIANEISILGKHEVGEDSTKYGEFVCTEYQWLPLEKQKEQAEKMANMTKKESGKKD